MRPFIFAIAAVAALGFTGLFVSNANALPPGYGVPYQYNYGNYVTPNGGYRSFSNYATPYGYNSSYYYSNPGYNARPYYSGPYHSVNPSPYGAYYGPGYRNNFGYANPYYGW